MKVRIVYIPTAAPANATDEMAVVILILKERIYNQRKECALL